MIDDMPLFSQLNVVKERFWSFLKEGGTSNCPVCGRFSHFNRFRINKAMIDDMIGLARYQIKSEFDEGWVHHSRFLTRRSRDFYNLKRWGLVEPKPNDTEKDQPTSGYWRITEKGVDFMRGEMSVPTYAFVFDDKVQGWSTEEVDIHQIRGDQFSYEEMLAGHYDIPAGGA